MASLERALQIAARAHEGQKDKEGLAYILHPLRVMGRVEGEEAQIVAILHDVVENASQVQGIFGPLHQALNRPPSLVGCRVSEKRPRLRRRGDASGEVKHDPAQEGGVVTNGGGLHAVVLPVFRHRRVDPIGKGSRFAGIGGEEEREQQRVHDSTPGETA